MKSPVCSYSSLQPSVPPAGDKLAAFNQGLKSGSVLQGAGPQDEFHQRGNVCTDEPKQGERFSPNNCTLWSPIYGVIKSTRE